GAPARFRWTYEASVAPTLKPSSRSVSRDGSVLLRFGVVLENRYAASSADGGSAVDQWNSWPRTRVPETISGDERSAATSRYPMLSALRCRRDGAGSSPNIGSVSPSKVVRLSPKAMSPPHSA